MDNKKKPLCKFKEKCPDWLAKRSCGFDHVLCKFNQTCKDKQKCIFYHMPKPTFDKPKSQTLCRFPNCSKPGCPFKHQKSTVSESVQSQNQNLNPVANNNPPINNQPRTRPPFGNNEGRICRFQPNCFRQTCKFLHPSRQNQNTSNNANQTRRQQNQFAPQMRIEANNNQRNPVGLQNRFCLQSLLQNNCPNGQRCQKSHEFTEKSSIKRIFFSNQIPDKDFNALFYQHQKQDQPQNKETIYILQQKQTISFRKLISAQNLYKDYGGIDPNQQNKTYLRSVTDQLFRAQNPINGIEAFTYNQNQYLVYMSGAMISIYNTTKGEVDSFSTGREGNKLTGCVLIQDKATLLVSTSETGAKKFQFNLSRGKFEERPFTQLTTGLKTLKITDSQILGEKVIFGVTNTNNLVLMNTDLRPMLIPFANGAIINDAQVCLVNNKVPVALVSVTFGSRQHHIVSVNLLNMEKDTIMQYEYTAGIDKILTIENHLMIEVKNKGLLIYKMNEFEKEIGMIPLLNEIQQVRKDNKGNLLILERTSISSKGSMSIFKIKRI